MPQGDKDAYTDKQKRKAAHIEDGYEKRGVKPCGSREPSVRFRPIADVSPSLRTV